jgi:hypothetical protein
MSYTAPKPPLPPPKPKEIETGEIIYKEIKE